MRRGLVLDYETWVEVIIWYSFIALRAQTFGSEFRTGSKYLTTRQGYLE